MAKLTISEASRIAGVARSTLQRAVQAGRLSLSPDHTVDTAELLRAGYTLHAARQPHDATALQDAAPRSSRVPHDAAGPFPQELSLAKREIALLERERDMLRAALDAAAVREQVALEREARLLHLLEQAQAQSQRLLEAPRPAPPPVPQVVETLLRRRPYADLPEVEPPPPEMTDYRGFMRQRVLQAMQYFPQGCTRRELEQTVGASKALTDVLQGMRRDGLIVRVGRGVYALPPVA